MKKFLLFVLLSFTLWGQIEQTPPGGGSGTPLAIGDVINLSDPFGVLFADNSSPTPQLAQASNFYYEPDVLLNLGGIPSVIIGDSIPGEGGTTTIGTDNFTAGNGTTGNTGDLFLNFGNVFSANFGHGISISGGGSGTSADDFNISVAGRYDFEAGSLRSGFTFHDNSSSDIGGFLVEVDGPIFFISGSASDDGFIFNAGGSNQTWSTVDFHTFHVVGDAAPGADLNASGYDTTELGDGNGALTANFVNYTLGVDGFTVVVDGGFTFTDDSTGGVGGFNFIADGSFNATVDGGFNFIADGGFNVTVDGGFNVTAVNYTVDNSSGFWWASPVASASLPNCTAMTGKPWRGSVNDATTPVVGSPYMGGGAVFANIHCSLTTGTYIVDGI